MPCNVRAAIFKKMIADLGGLAAVSALLEELTGDHASISTLSQMQNGNAQLSHRWVEIMENTLGRFPFHDMRRRELEQRAEEGASCPLELTSAAAKEGGEALSWGLKAHASGRAGDHARAAVESREASDAYGRLAGHHEGQGGANITPMRKQGAGV